MKDKNMEWGEWEQVWEVEQPAVPSWGSSDAPKQWGVPQGISFSEASQG